MFVCHYITWLLAVICSHNFEVNIFVSHFMSLGYDSVFSDLSWGVHNNLQFPCEFCDKVFRAKNSYYNHVNKHKGKTLCTVCNKQLSTVSNLKAHMAQKHTQ